MKSPFSNEDWIRVSRRDFLTSAASGLGALALASLFREDSLLAEPASITGPGQVKAPHFAPKAKRCIFLFMEGAPSQVDLFDPKPKLNELHGQKLPDSILGNTRFAFIQKETATVLGTNRTFQKYGQSGMDFCDLLPGIASHADDMAMVRSMHTDQFNHHPGQLMMNCGVPRFGHPSMGSWLNYGLGSVSKNLPGYVVLTSGKGIFGGASLWSSGFLPTHFQGVPFRNEGDPILNLATPRDVPEDVQHYTRDLLKTLNSEHFEKVRDPEVASRIEAYELAFQMQVSAPELMDISSESPAALEAYGVNRTDPPLKADRSGGPNQYRNFARNCLLARRLVERGVRFVNVYHATWDHHSNLNAELEFNARMADQPIAALLKDLKERGLLEDTLVVWGSEFGRTPLGENRAGNKNVSGRDHHPLAFSMWMAGGGVKGGQVYGATDEIGWKVVRDGVHINDLHATILHLFGLDHEKLTYRFQGRDFRLTDVAGEVVRPLLA